MRIGGKYYISTCVHVQHIPAAANIQERHLVHSVLPIVQLLFEGSDYLKAVSNQSNTVV